MPKAEFELPPARRGDEPLLITVHRRTRAGTIRIDAAQNGESAFIEMSVMDWSRIFAAVFTNALEKKP